MTLSVSEVLFWLALALVAYPYLLYPALLGILPARRRWRAAAAGSGVAAGSARPGVEPAPPLPAMSVLVAARNEEAQIAMRLDDLLAQDYPPDRLEVIVASDASEDGTDAAVAGYAARGVRLVRCEERAGKVGALNRALRHASGRVLVFTDAASRFRPGTLRALAAPFEDPEVGCVSTEDEIVGRGGEGLYIRYEMALRRLEARFHSLVGASGSGYAVRRDLAAELPDRFPNDFAMPLVALSRGFRAVPEPRAVAAYADAGAGLEFQRKVRTVIRGLATLFWGFGLLPASRHPRAAFLLVSHKLLRWTVPVALVVLFATSAALFGRGGLWRLPLLAQAALYGAGVVGLVAPPLRALLPFRIAHYFLVANAGIAVAWARFVAGERPAAWEPTRREGTA